MSLPGPFPKTAPPVYWFVNPFTDHLVDAIRKEKRFANMGVAVIDLTFRTRRPDGVGWTTFAGWNMYDQRFAASLVKIAAMFAAYRLKENLQEAAKQVTAKDGKDLFKQITAEWKPIVETAVKSAPADFPNLSKVFTVSGASGGWTINFAPLFAKHLRGMIEHSYNHSAAYCINTVGFQYINGALAAEGLYSHEFGGLWLGANYQGRVWKREHKINTAQGATAKAVATFLTLLEDSRLVSPKASEDMRGLMGLAGSWLSEGLRKAKPQPRPHTSYAKVGLHGTYHDCAVIERSQGNQRIRYAAVGLTAQSAGDLHRLIVKLDDYVVASNV